MIKSSKLHLKKVEETYFEHQRVAFSYGLRCLKAACMAFVHGIIPGFFQTNASDLIKRLAENRKHPE